MDLEDMQKKIYGMQKALKEAHEIANTSGDEDCLTDALLELIDVANDFQDAVQDMIWDIQDNQ